MKIFFAFLIALIGPLGGLAQRTVRNPSFVSKKLFIKDTTLYSHKFLEQLRGLANGFPDTLKVIDNVIISPDHVTCNFPQSIPLKRTYLLEAGSANLEFKLRITRINLSDIDFEFVLLKDKTIAYKNTGTGVLFPLFFFGAESFTDDRTGLGFSAVGYSASTKGCDFQFFINVEEGELRAVISAPDCFTPKVNEANCPTLRAKL